MKSSVIDSYQLSSLIELTSNLADESMQSDLPSNTILLNAVNKLLWTLNFDHCLIMHSNGATEYLYGDSEDLLIHKITKHCSKEDRYSLAFNLFPKGKFGCNDSFLNQIQAFLGFNA